MLALNLPEFDYKLEKADSKVWIFDVIRKKYVLLTPEEWVRQHIIHYCITHLNYPKALVKIEGGLRYNKLQKRSDIVVYDRNGKPWMLIECKSPDVKLSQASIRQAAMYNVTVGAQYIVVSNGLKHICYKVNEHNEASQLKDFPEFTI